VERLAAVFGSVLWEGTGRLRDGLGRNQKKPVTISHCPRTAIPNRISFTITTRKIANPPTNKRSIKHTRRHTTGTTRRGSNDDTTEAEEEKDFASDMADESHDEAVDVGHIAIDACCFQKVSN